MLECKYQIADSMREETFFIGVQAADPYSGSSSWISAIVSLV
ncbi:MAG: hypothetical protein QXN83_03975 [Nitrososphaerales archaeon]